MSRLRFPLALLAAAVLATAFAACGDEGGSPQAVVEDATLEGIESGVIDLTLDARSPGRRGGKLDLRLSGPFQGEGEGELPQLDLKAKVDARAGERRIDFDGGLVLLPNTAYVEYEGVDYEVDPTTYAFVEGTLEEQRRQAGGEGSGEEAAAACQEALGELQVDEFLEEARSETDARVGDTETTKVSGDLDVSGALQAVLDVTESPACAAQLSAASEQLPSRAEIEEAKGEVEEGVRTARVDIYVGEDDIVRRIVAKLKIEPQDDGGEDEGPRRLEIDLDLQLTEVNEEQEISAPEGKVRPLGDLFVKIGVNPIELLGLLQGEGGQEGLQELLEGLGDGKGGGEGGLEGLGELFEGLGGSPR